VFAKHRPPRRRVASPCVESTHDRFVTAFGEEWGGPPAGRCSPGHGVFPRAGDVSARSWVFSPVRRPARPERRH
jgi:hypothetical protein